MVAPPSCGKVRNGTSSFICPVLYVCLICLTVAFWPVSAKAATTCRSMDNTKIINLINAYRLRNGLALLKPNSRLAASTSLKVKDMIRQSYFAHTNPEGRPFSDNIRKARYDYRSVAEVLAKGCRSEVQVLSLWIKSRAHNDALLDPVFSDINCSSSVSRGLAYVACHLGRPRAALSFSQY